MIILIELIIQIVLIILFGVLGGLSLIQKQFAMAGINLSLFSLYIFLYLGKYLFR